MQKTLLDGLVQATPTDSLNRLICQPLQDNLIHYRQIAPIHRINITHTHCQQVLWHNPDFTDESIITLKPEAARCHAVSRCVELVSQRSELAY